MGSWILNVAIGIRAGGRISKRHAMSCSSMLHILERLLDPYPQIMIVLSTSWVQTYRFSATTGKLSQSLRDRVIGVTFHTEMDIQSFRDVPRGRQIWVDVLRRQPSEWVALDDDQSNWPAAIRNRLVHTDGLLGLGEERVQLELRQHFERLVSAHGSHPSL